ncbi:MAG TPA: serine hydrolase, partial [Actinomycetes bacterium]|nr:serine hydrolase [Actinomycetes bacterium]
YRGDGAFGQFCVVLPEQDVVVATTGGTEAMQAVLDSLWEHLLPGLGTGRPDAAAHRELAQRLAGLSLPACVAKPSPPRWRDWTGRPFPVAPGADGALAAPLTSVALRQADHGLEVTVAEPANALTFPVGGGDWLVSAPRDRHGDPVPVATSGGWLDDHSLRVEVIFLESPHRMDIACSLLAGTAEAAWRHPPLDGGRLQTLHRPR